jgi:streptomycin 6-kinase
VTTNRIVVAAELTGFHVKYYEADGKAWSAALPEPTASYFGRWELRLDGPLRRGMVVPVR